MRTHHLRGVGQNEEEEEKQLEKYRALVVEAGGEKKRRGVNIIIRRKDGYDSRDETTFGRINSNNR